jgi:4'-phosphopantetheinyl transferase
MHKIDIEDCIRCSFDHPSGITLNYHTPKVEVYYGFTNELDKKCTEIMKLLTHEEKLRSENFRFTCDRNTFILSHGLLRLMLSLKFGQDPKDMVFVNGKFSKPEIPGKQIFFNITHVRDAFAFVISGYNYAGIDMETADRWIDVKDLIDAYFSEKECIYIRESQINAMDRFFLLWTRKESLLKAFGTGIVDDLKKIDLLNKNSMLNSDIFEGLLSYKLVHEHFIYSEKISKYYMSVALPHKSEITFEKIDETNIQSFLSKIDNYFN